MVRPYGPTTCSGTGKTLRRRTVEPAPRASAPTTGTMASLSTRPSIGVKILFGIVLILRPLFTSDMVETPGWALGIPGVSGNSGGAQLLPSVIQPGAPTPVEGRDGGS